MLKRDNLKTEERILFTATRLGSVASLVCACYGIGYSHACGPIRTKAANSNHWFTTSLGQLLKSALHLKSALQMYSTTFLTDNSNHISRFFYLQPARAADTSTNKPTFNFFTRGGRASCLRARFCATLLLVLLAPKPFGGR